MADSVLLQRIRAFLPQIEQANEELEKKMKEHGASSVVIDNDMLGTVLPQATSSISISKSSSSNSGVIIDTTDDGDDDRIVEQDEEEQTTKQTDSRVIELEFALGDFDDTPIALAEEKLREITDDGTRQDDDDEGGNDAI